METILLPINKIKNNPNNPRIIRDDKFKKLVRSIKDFPEMLKIRPIVINKEFIVLGGNMRLKACKEAGLKNVSIIQASQLTEEQQKEFIVKDNVGFGDWDLEELSSWNIEKLDDWGIDKFRFEEEEEIDYSILDDTNIDSDVEDMRQGVKKAIQIPFELSDYEEAQEIYKFWREKDAYVGKMFIDFLKSEKNKL